MSALDLSEIHGAIRTKHLCVPRDRFILFTPSASAQQAATKLADLGYDNAPVLDDDSFVGVFRRQQYRADQSVGSVMQKRQLEHVVTADTTYRDLLAHLMDQPLLLVLEGRQIIGLVTPGDMGSAPGRTHFYLLLSGLEIAAAEWVRQLYPSDGGAERALALLVRKRADEIRALHSSLVAQDDHLDLIAAFGLHDLVEVIKKTKLAAAQVRTAGVSFKGLKSLSHFRNDVMHPVREFAHANAVGLARLRKWDSDLTAALGAIAQAVTSKPENDSTTTSITASLPKDSHGSLRGDGPHHEG